MDLRRLPGPPQDRRFGRRASDAPTGFWQAAFVAQVAGLSLPEDKARTGYAGDGPRAPAGLLTDAKV